MIEKSLHSIKRKPKLIGGNVLQSIAQYLLSLPRYVKRLILISADFIMAIACLLLSLLLRYGYVELHVSWWALALYALIPVVSLYVIGFYHSVSRGFLDTVMSGVLQLFVVLIVFYELIIYFDLLPQIPRSTPILFLFFLYIWLWNSRLTIKELLKRWQGKRFNGELIDYDNILIYGAGEAGQELIKGLSNSHKYSVVAFVDDDRQLTGAHIMGKKIYHTDNLLDIVNILDIAQVFLAVPSISRARKREIIEKLSHISIKIKELPSLQELADEKVTVSHMRKIDILDVLDRQTVEPDEKLLKKNIAHKSVLVTGAGGSIGSELCRQIIKNKPTCLVLYELSEFALYSIHQELIAKQASHSEYHNIQIVAVIGNVTDEHNLMRIFQTYHVQTVYHAAAYKHVPMVEHNPFQGVINNTRGTYHCARAAIQTDVETFVLISTDKAVRPTNVMGASKRLAELVCQALSHEIALIKPDSKTCISMVRFGNVLGSSGSVVPVFTKQIEQGLPITVTHPDVTRYFMTIPEAANLVIQAGAMAKGGEVFVLNMGEPVKIVDLAQRMIHLSGHEVKNEQYPHGDIEIIFTGLRPGEKLYEELIIGDDNVEDTAHPLIMQAMEHRFALAEVEQVLMELSGKSQLHDVTWLKAQFKYFVEGYKEDTTVNL